MRGDPDGTADSDKHAGGQDVLDAGHFRCTPNTARIPHEVVEWVIEKEFNLLKAWRKYLGFTQKTVAQRAGISQSALSQMERTETNHRTATLEKLAKALGIETAQLVD